MASASPASSGETGFQLLARLTSRPSLRNLWNESLFPGGLDPGEVVEVSSDAPGGGKTELMLNLTAKSIAPEVWGHLDVEGLGVSVIYIDASMQFDLKRLATILDMHLRKRAQQQQKQQQQQEKKVETEQYIKTCLSRLHLLRPANSDELVLALEMIKDNFLMANQEVGLLVLDSLNAYYWLERAVDIEKGVKFYESTNHKRICASLAAIVDAHRINIVATLGNVFRPKAPTEESTTSEEDGVTTSKDDVWTCKDWRDLRNYKLKLCKKIVYQDKADGPPAAAVVAQDDRNKRLNQVPNQLVSYSLFNCSSKTVEKRGEILIKSAGINGL